MFFNESGFIRIYILPRENPFLGIRMNYWNNFQKQTETIHNHKNPFSSFILSGGYTHTKYKKNKEKINSSYDPYTSYRLFSNEKREKKFLLNGTTYLRKIGDETFEAGDVVDIDTNVIHEVCETQKNTLTLNLIYYPSQHLQDQKEACGYPYHEIFLSEKGLTSDLKTERAVVVNKKDSIEIKETMLEILEKYK